MLKKLDVKSFHYLRILYIIRYVLEYYSQRYQLMVPECIIDLDAGIVYEKSMTYVRIRVPVIGHPDVTEMRTTLNEYLSLALAAQKFPPFAAGKDIADMIEQLYFTLCIESDGYLYYKVLYIDNMDAYRMVRQMQNENLSYII